MGRKQARGRKHLHLCLAALIVLSVSGCAIPQKIRTEKNHRGEAGQHLRRARELFVQKDFEAALNENQEILILATGQPPEDEALFYIGIIFGHPDYAGQDSAKSVYFFTRLVEAYPGSPWAMQALAWIKMFQKNQRLSQRLEQLNHQLKQFQQEKLKVEEEKAGRRPLLASREFLSQGKYEEAFREIQKILSSSPRHPMEDEALFQAGVLYAHPGNPKKDYGKSISYFRKLIKEHPQSPWTEWAKDWIGMLQENDRLNQTIEKLNQTIEKSKQVDIEIEEKRREKGK